MDAIRAEAPNTIVIITADNGAWQDAWPAFQRKLTLPLSMETSRWLDMATRCV